MDKPYSGIDKRSFPRLEANFVVSYRIKEISLDYDLSQTKNISRGGLMLTTNRKLEQGAKLAITIRFPFTPKRLEVIGEVVDSKEVAKGLIYETRVKFPKENTDFFKQLGEFIEQRITKK